MRTFRDSGLLLKCLKLYYLLGINYIFHEGNGRLESLAYLQGPTPLISSMPQIVKLHQQFDLVL